jgi:hypothetical protein
MKTHHIRLAMHHPRNTNDYIAWAKHVVQSMTNNSHLPSPSPPVATVSAHIAAYETAHAAAHPGDKTATAEGHKLLQQVVDDVHAWAAYVQGVADGDPPNAPVIIASSGFGTAPHGVHARPQLHAAMGPGGIVILHARGAGRDGVHEWRMSTDGGHTHTALPATKIAHTSVAGLALGTAAAFDHRVNVGTQTGDWSDSVTLVVH